MLENLRQEQGQNLQERLEALPVDQREKLEASWKTLEELTPKGELPEGVTISKVEHENAESTKGKIAEMQDFLKKAKQELKSVKAILGEAELGDDDAVRRERAFNRYAGMKRVYGKDKKGKLSEVLYEAPPEDESIKGAPANFMVRLIDGRNTMSKDEYTSIVRGIHSQYSRPEYFTSEYFAFLEEGDPSDFPQEDVDRYRQRYLGITEKIQQKIEKKLKPAQGDLILLSEREKRKGAE